MSATFDIGTLAGYISLDATPLREGEREAVATVQRIGQALGAEALTAGRRTSTNLAAGVTAGASAVAAAATQAGTRAGTAMGSAVQQSAAQGASQAGARLGAGLTRGVTAAIPGVVTATQRLGAAAELAADNAKTAMAKYQAALRDAEGGNEAAAESARRLGAQATIAAGNAQDAMRRYSQAAAAAASDTTAGLNDAVANAGAGAAAAGADAGSGFGEKFSDGLKGALGAAGIGAMIVNAMDADTANVKLAQQLGLTKEESARIGKDAGQLFSANYGEGLEDVNDALHSVIQNVGGMRDASDESLKAITGQVMSVAQTFDQDLGGVTRAVGQAMKTGMAPDAQSALDLITKSFQAGDDKAEDLLDTINEYGTQFRKAGLTGADAMGLIRQGLQGGARDADIVADQVKEIGIRLQDGSAVQGLNQLGLNGAALSAQFKAGGSGAKAALDEIFDRVRSLGGATKNMGALTLVAGTQVEDLGAAFDSLDVSDAAAQLGDVSGAAKNLDSAVGGTQQASLATFGRTLASIGQQAGKDLLPIIDPVVHGLGLVTSGAGHLTAGLAAVPQPVSTAILAMGGLLLLGPKIVSAAGTMRTSFMNLGGATTGLKGSFGALGKALAGGAIFAGITYIVDSWSSSMAKAKAIDDDLGRSIQTVSDVLVTNGGRWDDNAKKVLEASVKSSTNFQDLIKSGVSYADAMDLLTGKTTNATKVLREIHEAPGIDHGRTVELFGYVGGLMAIREGAEKTAAGERDYAAQQAATAAATAKATAAAHERAKVAAGIVGATQTGNAAEADHAAALEVTTGKLQSANAAEASHAASVAATAAAVGSANSAERDQQASYTESQRRTNDLVVAQADLARAVKEVHDAPTKDFAGMEAAIKGVTDQTSRASTETSAFAIEIDKLTGRNVPLQDATKNLNDQVRALAETFGDAKATADAHAASLINDKGVIDTTTEAGSKLYDSVTSYSDAYNTSVTAAMDAAGAHATVAQKVKAARDEADVAYQSFVAQAKGLGLSDSQARTLATSMGILEGKKLTPKTLHLDAQDEATRKVDDLNAKVQGLQNKVISITVSTTGQTVSTRADGSFVTGSGAIGRANGGLVFGPGSGTSDSILTRLSNREGVNTAAAMSHEENVRAMHFMNSGGVIPGFKNGGQVHLDMSAAGNIQGALSGVQKMFGNADSSAAKINSAAAAAAKAAASSYSAVANQGSGVERWRPLALRALAMDGDSPSLIGSLLRRMNQESGGNPNIFNNWDSNAQKGTPSGGLMQTIKPTFDAYAMPGYDKNMLDPLSNILASLRYAKAAYGSVAAAYDRAGGYARGDLVRGPGSGTSDSVLAKVSNGEGINTSDAMSHPENVAAMRYMNRGGVIPGFATGGLVSAGTLAGNAPQQYGDRTGRVVDARSSIAQTLADLRAAAVDAAVKSREALKAYHETQKQGIRDVAEAQKRVNEAKTAGEKKAANAALKAAEHRAAVELKLALLAQNRASVTAAAAKHNATDATAAQQALQGTYRTLQGLATKYDSLTGRLGTAKDLVASTRQDKAQAVAGYATSIAGFDGGLTGHSDVRGTSGSIVNGLRYDLSKIKSFYGDLATLRKRGASAQMLNELTGAFGSGGEITAHALATGSVADLRATAALQGQINTAAGRAAAIAPSAQYDSAIKAQTANVATLTRALADTNRRIEANSNLIESRLVKAISGWQFRMDGKGLLTLIHPAVQAQVNKKKGQR